MTVGGSIFGSAKGHALFAASRAPNHYSSKFLHGIMGAACAISFDFGAKYRKQTFKEINNSCNKDNYSGDIMDTVIVSERIIDGLAVIIPALVKTSQEVEMLQNSVDAIGTDAVVIVVDDESSYSLESLLTGCIVIRHPKNLGPAAARNSGTSLALQLGATAIGFTDVDCLPDSEWAKAHASLQAADPGIWAGRTVAANPGLIADFHDYTGTLMPRLRTPTSTDALYAPTCNLSISKEVAETLQFDPAFPTSAFEDVDFCLRARLSHGFLIKVSDRPVVQHFFEPGWLSPLRSYHKYGQSYPLLLQRHPTYPQDQQHSVPLSAFSSDQTTVDRMRPATIGPLFTPTPKISSGLLAWSAIWLKKRIRSKNEP